MARRYFYCKPGTGTGAGNDDNATGIYTSQQTGTWASAFAGTTEYMGELSVAASPGGTAPIAGDLVLVSDATSHNLTVDELQEFASGVSIIMVDDDTDITVGVVATGGKTTADTFVDVAYYGDHAVGLPHNMYGYGFDSGGSIKPAQANGTILNSTFMEITRATGGMKYDMSGYGYNLVSSCSTFLCDILYDQYMDIALGATALLMGGEFRAGDVKAGYLNYRSSSLKMYGVDLSNSAANIDLFNFANNLNASFGYAYRCELPSGWSIGTINGFSQGAVVESCTSEYQFEYHTYTGVISLETGANDPKHADDDTLNDGSTKGSLKYACNTSANDIFPLMTFLPSMPRFLSATNTESSTKAKVRIKFGTATADTLDDSNVWVYVLYPDSTNTYLMKCVQHVVPPGQAGTALSTQTSKWTGTTPSIGNEYYLDVTMTSPGDGLVLVMVGFHDMGTATDIYLSLQPEFVA